MNKKISIENTFPESHVVPSIAPNPVLDEQVVAVDDARQLNVWHIVAESL